MSLKQESRPQTKPTLLLVESDPNSLDQLNKALASHFELRTMSNAIQAYVSARRLRPAGIISEITLANTSGLDLVNQIREHPDLAATPFIFLSAQHSEVNRVRGYEALADLYLTKPFHSGELLASVLSLLHIRRLVCQSVRPSQFTSIPQVRSQQDQALLDRLDVAIRSRLDDSTLQVRDIARACFTSERQLERKLQDLLQISPRYYLRNLRMEQAWIWLESGKYASVCMVARAVGYRNERSFQRAFQAVFDQNPSQLSRS